MKVRVLELCIPLIAACCTILFTCLTLHRVALDHPSGILVSRATLVPVSFRTAIGTHPTYLGDPHAAYTLIEFADYQCPPCREANQQLAAVLDRYRGQLKLTFRNFPLTEIHEQAQQSAILAEASRLKGCFWAVHDDLYSHQNELSPANLQKLLIAHRIDPSHLNQKDLAKARAAVEEDIRFADKLGLNGTPSFLLCCPDGRIWQLASLNQIERYLN